MRERQKRPSEPRHGVRERRETFDDRGDESEGDEVRSRTEKEPVEGPHAPRVWPAEEPRKAHQTHENEDVKIRGRSSEREDCATNEREHRSDEAGTALER
jgi:hypothetical protein